MVFVANGSRERTGPPPCRPAPSGLGPGPREFPTRERRTPHLVVPRRPSRGRPRRGSGGGLWGPTPPPGQGPAPGGGARPTGGQPAVDGTGRRAAERGGARPRLRRPRAGAVAEPEHEARARGGRRRGESARPG